MVSKLILILVIFSTCLGQGVTDIDGECDLVTVYSECNFDGEKQELTEDTDCIDFETQSVCLPEGHSIILYDICGYDGEGVHIEETTSCLSVNSATLTTLTLMDTKNKKSTPTKKFTYKIEENN